MDLGRQNGIWEGLPTSLEQATSFLILPAENVGIGQVIVEDGFTPLSVFIRSPNDPGFPARLSSGHTIQD